MVALREGRKGLSPRVRGSRRWRRNRLTKTGSIPAGAGEPPGGPSRTRLWVKTGLSPRVRGSRRHPTRWSVSEGSIPAGAGEPRCPMTRPANSRVYPRGCGGAIRLDVRRASVSGKGLSPRVRGSLRRLDPRAPPSAMGLSPRVRGSPSIHRGGIAPKWVYPRGCGGATKPPPITM